MESNLAQPRICHLKKTSNFPGYGFKLHTNHRFDPPSHQIYGVEANSPAERAGVRNGDRVRMVNFVHTQGLNHWELVDTIASGVQYAGRFHKDEVILILTDIQTESFLNRLNVDFEVFSNCCNDELKSQTSQTFPD